MKHTLHVQLDDPLSGVENMARDSALLEKAEGGIVGARVYSWEGPWVSIGRFQSAERDLVPGTPVPWVKRPTGGKAVLHGHDVTVGLAVPLDALELDSRKTAPVYRALIGPIVEALRDCGVPAVLAEGTRHEKTGLRTGDCFAFTSSNDVVHEATGLKVCGCALRIKERAALVQASIPNGKHLVDPREVLLNASALVGPEWNSGGFAEKLQDAMKRLVEKHALR